MLMKNELLPNMCVSFSHLKKTKKKKYRKLKQQVQYHIMKVDALVFFYNKILFHILFLADFLKLFVKRQRWCAGLFISKIRTKDTLSFHIINKFNGAITIDCYLPEFIKKLIGYLTLEIFVA
jgi:hypothetical protein